MSDNHYAGPNVSAFRRVTNSRWFPPLFGLAVLGVIFYLNGLSNRSRVAGRRPPSPRKKWETFSWPEASLKVVMPESPELFHERNELLGTAFDLNGYHSTSGSTTYLVAYADYPPDLPLPENDDELMEQASMWLGVHAINDDATVEKITYREHSGLEVNRIARARSGRLLRNHSRWFLIGRRGIIIGATGDNDDFDERGATEFLDSLRFKQAP